MTFVPGDSTLPDDTMAKAIYDAMVATLGANPDIDPGRIQAAVALAVGVCNHANPRLPSGGVVGPVASTDGAVPRYDGSTGQAIKDSPVTIDDAGNIETSGTVDGRDVSADGSTLDAHAAQLATIEVGTYTPSYVAETALGTDAGHRFALYLRVGTVLLAGVVCRPEVSGAGPWRGLQIGIPSQFVRNTNQYSAIGVVTPMDDAIGPVAGTQTAGAVGGITGDDRYVLARWQDTLASGTHAVGVFFVCEIDP